MIHAIFIVIHTIATIFYHFMSIGDIYIPNTQLMNSVEGQPVSQYYQGGQANTSMNSANHTAQQQIFDFYWGLNPYLHMVRPATQFAREMTGWCADFVYGVDTFLQTLYVNLFALMDIKSTYNPTSSFWTILHWGQSLGIVACILATIIYFGMIIIMPKSDLFEKLRILFQQIIIGTAVIGIFPNVANGFASGLEYAANVLIGNESNGAGGSGKTMGSMSDDMFRYNVISVPHKITTFGLNPNGTPINSSSSGSSSSSSQGSSNSTQGQQPNSDANNTANVIHVPESGNRIRYRPKSTFFNPDSSEEGTAEGQQIYSHEVMINLNAMGPSEANGWNGLWDESIPSFLHEYESDDSILNPSEDDAKRDAALKGKADRYDNNIYASAEDPTKRNQLINQCIKDGEGGKGTCRMKYPRTSLGAGFRKHADDFFENMGTHPLKSGFGLKGAFGGGTTTISPLNKMINNLTITAHATYSPAAQRFINDDKPRMKKGKPSMGNPDSKGAPKGAAYGKATGTKTPEQQDSNSSQGSLGIFGYELNGTDDYAAIDQIQEGFFSKHAGGATTAFYDKYKVQWFDIFTGLILLAWIFIAFIAKLIGAFFKVSVMYATLGIFIYKSVSAPQAWKVFIKSFFGIYEMLLMDLIVIRLWFIIYMIVNNAIDAIVFHAVGADANGAVAGLVQFACDVVTATMAIKGVGAVDKILGPGANSGAQDSWGHALTAMSLLRGGAGLASMGYRGGKGAIHLGAKGAKGIGHGASKLGHGLKNLRGKGGVKPSARHKAPGRLSQRAKQGWHNFKTRNNSAYAKDKNGNNVLKSHLKDSANKLASTPNDTHNGRHSIPKGDPSAHSRMARLHGKHSGRTGATTADSAITPGSKKSGPKGHKGSKGTKKPNTNNRKGTSKKPRKQSTNRKSRRKRRSGRPHFAQSGSGSTGASSNDSQSTDDNDTGSDNEDSDTTPTNTSSDTHGYTTDPNYVDSSYGLGVDSSYGLGDNSMADDYGKSKGLEAESRTFGTHGTTEDSGTPMDTYTLGNQHSPEGNTQSRIGDNQGDGRIIMFVPHRNSGSNRHSLNSSASLPPRHHISNGSSTTNSSNTKHSPRHHNNSRIPPKHHIRNNTAYTSGSRVQSHSRHTPNNNKGTQQTSSRPHINDNVSSTNSGSTVQNPSSYTPTRNSTNPSTNTQGQETKKQASHDTAQGTNDNEDTSTPNLSQQGTSNATNNDEGSSDNDADSQPTTSGNLGTTIPSTTGSNPQPRSDNVTGNSESVPNGNNSHSPQTRRLHQNADRNINRRRHIQNNNGIQSNNRGNSNNGNSRTIIDRNINRHINNNNDVDNNGSNVVNGSSNNGGNQQTIVRNHVHDINNNHTVQHNNGSTNSQPSGSNPTTRTVTQTNTHTTSTNQTNSTTGTNNNAVNNQSQNIPNNTQSIPSLSTGNAPTTNNNTHIGNINSNPAPTTGSSPQTTRTINQNVDRNINNHHSSTINRNQPTTTNNRTQRVVVNRNINRHINNNNDVNVNNTGGGSTGTTRQRTVIHNHYHDIVNNRTNQHINNTPSTTGSSPTINDTSLENTFDKSINNLGNSSVLNATGSNPQSTNTQPTTQTHNIDNNINRNIQHTNNDNGNTDGSDDLSSGMFRDMLGGEDNNQPTHFSNLTPHGDNTGSSHLGDSNNGAGSNPDFSEMLHHNNK